MFQFQRLESEKGKRKIQTFPHNTKEKKAGITEIQERLVGNDHCI